MRRNAKPHQHHKLPKSARAIGYFCQLDGKLLMLANRHTRGRLIGHQLRPFNDVLVKRMYQERVRLSDSVLRITVEVIPNDKL